MTFKNKTQAINALRRDCKTPAGLRDFAAELRRSNWRASADAAEAHADAWERELAVSVAAE